MSGPAVVLIPVLLMQFYMCTGASNPLTVRIVASYAPPHGFTEDPPSYRAASPLTLTCEVEGGEQYSGFYYQWSSTCSGNCFTVGQYTKTVSTPYYLHHYDTGVHTCTVYNYGALGLVGSASISVNVVGAGIFIPFGSKVLSNNSLITIGVAPFLFHCLSGSSITNAGSLIGVEGDYITSSSSTSDPFLVSRPPYDPSTMHVRRSFRPLHESENGIYTYRTLDENGEMVDFHFGVYSSSNAGPPMIESLSYTLTENSVHTLHCTSYSSPPTIVQWEKEGETIHLNNTIYQLSQILLERNSSTYKNVLTINAAIEDVVGEYSCRVSNTLGTSDETFKSVQVLEVRGHESPVLVGLSRSINCSTHLEVTRMEWVQVGVAEPVEEREDGGQSLALSISPTDTGLNGAEFTCKVTTATGKTFEKTITVEIKEIPHTVDITGPSNPLSAGGKHTFTCTVTSDLAPSVKWLDPDNNEVDGSDVSVIMDNMVVDGNTTTLLLHFDPLKTSHGGTYACVSTISEPSSFKRMTRHLKVQIVSDSTTVTRSPSSNTVFTTDSLTLTCVTVVNQYVDIPVQVSHQWMGPGGVNINRRSRKAIDIVSATVVSATVVSSTVAIIATNPEESPAVIPRFDTYNSPAAIPRFYVSHMTQSGHNYSSTFFFRSLHSSDAGTYTCSSTVTAAQSSVFIASSAVTTASTSFTATISVAIQITYTSPGTYPVYSPPNYRTASGVSLRCVASGYSGSISYHWTSTCSSCFASNSNSQTISESFLRSRDAGVHTCTVTDGLGNTGSNSTTMNIVGVGVYIQYAESSHIQNSSGIQGVQPSNTFATATRRLKPKRVDVYCCSNATSTIPASSARFILPTGSEYTAGYYHSSINYGQISTLSGASTGCIRLHYSRLPTSSFYLSSYGYDGIYTCKIPDSSGNYLYENFGLYNEGFYTQLSISQLLYSTNADGSVILTCKTRYSPPSSIRWYRENQLLDIDGQTTNMSVTVTDRESSYFDIVLTLCDSPANVRGTYKCEAGNRLGTDTETHSVAGLQLQCSSSEFVVGETVTCSCSSDIGSNSAVSWSSSNTGSTSNTESLTISVTTESHGDVYTCSVSTSCDSYEESVTVVVTVPNQWATVSVHNSTGENALNNTDYTLTCTVTPIEGMTLPITVEWVGPDGGVVASQGNVMVGKVEVQGTVSILNLSFSPVFSSDAGSYTCRAAITVSWMDTQPSQHSATVHMPVTSQSIFQLKLYPVPLCVDWNLDKAHDLERDIKREVEKAVRECCNCAFSSSAIHSGEFNCQFLNSNSANTFAIYRAVLNGTSDLLTAPQLMQHLQDWRGTGGTLLYNNLLRLGLASDTECRVKIESFEDKGC